MYARSSYRGGPRPVQTPGRRCLSFPCMSPWPDAPRAPGANDPTGWESATCARLIRERRQPTGPASFARIRDLVGMTSTRGRESHTLSPRRLLTSPSPSPSPFLIDHENSRSPCGMRIAPIANPQDFQTSAYRWECEVDQSWRGVVLYHPRSYLGSLHSRCSRIQIRHIAWEVYLSNLANFTKMRQIEIRNGPHRYPFIWRWPTAQAAAGLLGGGRGGGSSLHIDRRGA